MSMAIHSLRQGKITCIVSQFEEILNTSVPIWGFRHKLKSNFSLSHRVYCKDLKPPDKDKNNTEFLMEFNNYIDTKTPNNPMCEYLNEMLNDAMKNNVLLWKN